MDREGYFSVRDIVDFIFCKRIIYFRYCIRVSKELTTKMVKGREIHKILTDKSKRTRVIRDLSAKKNKKFNLRIFSRRYNLNAMIDCLLLGSDNEAYLVEFKFSSRKRIFRTYKYQLAAQALVVEEKFGLKVPLAYLKFSDGSVVDVKITKKDRKNVIKALEEMEFIIRSETIPEPTKFRKRCKECHYRNLCRKV